MTLSVVAVCLPYKGRWLDCIGFCYLLSSYLWCFILAFHTCMLLIIPQ